MRHLRTFFTCIIFIAFESGVYAQWISFTPFVKKTRMTAIAVSPDGTVWAGGYEGVSRLDGDIWARFTEDDGLGSDIVSSIAIGSDGVIWIGGSNGVSRLDGEVWTTFTEDDGLVGYVRDIAIGPDGTVWACGRGWLCMYNDGIWIPSTPDLAPVDLDFVEMAVDPDGVVWLAAGRYGIYLYYDGLWEKFDDEERTYYFNNRSVAIDSDGVVWVGRTAGRIDRFNGETWTTLLEGDSEARGLNFAHYGLENKLNTIIIMEQNYYSAHGEYVDFDFGESCDPIGWTSGHLAYLPPFELSFQDSVAIAREVDDINRDGDTTDGLTLSISKVQGSIEGSNLTWAPLIDESPKGYDVITITIEPGGALWFGTNYGGGLHRYEDGIWTSYTTEDGLADNTVNDLAIAPDGTVWAATGNGISNIATSTTIVEMDDDTPSEFTVTGNFPNPFNPTTTIEFSLPTSGFTTLTIYNIMGQKVRELVADTMQAGTHSVVWNGKDDSGTVVSSGVFVSRLKTGNKVVSSKMMLVR